MKKTLSLLLVLCLILTLTFSAFAGEAHKLNDISAELDSTVDYLTNGVTAYTVDSAVNYYYLSNVSNKADSYFDGFLQDVIDNLEAHDGKIIPSFGENENIVTYAAIISILDRFDKDVSDINGVNLVDLMKNTPVSTISEPYYYDIVIPTAASFCDKEFTVNICNEFIANNYTMGSGLYYYGFSCDNTAMFISAISQSGCGCYDEVLEDAMAVLDTYKVEGGYCYSPEYGTDANADSTALALKAKSAYFLSHEATEEDMADLAELYGKLLTFKGETTGSYTYAGAESAYAAFDALRGIEMYYALVSLEETPDAPDDNDDGNTVENGESGNNENKNENQEQNNHENKNDVVIPNTDSAQTLAIFVITTFSALTAASISLRKKED